MLDRSSWVLRAGTAALIASALVLSGCGTGGPAGGSGKKGVLEVWFPGNSKPEIDLVTKELAPKFEKANGVKVKITYVDWTQISPKLNTGFAGNVAPDVFGHGPAAAAGFVDADRISSLDGFLDKMPAQDRKDIEAYLPGGQVDSTQYMIPLSGQGSLVAYRKDLFEKAGVSPPTTWADALAAAKKLTVRKGGKVVRSGIQLPSAAIQREQTFASLLASEGGELISEDGVTVGFDSEAGVAALKYQASLYDGADAVSNQLGADFGTRPPAQHPLATGKAAMAGLFSNQLIGIIRDRPDLADKVGVLEPLEGADQAATFGGAGPGLFINKDSKNQALAWKFIEFMVSKTVADRYAETAGAIPVRASSIESSYVTDQPLLKPYIEAGPSYVPSPNVPAWVQVRDVLDKQIERALGGKLTPEAALKAAAKEAGPLLKG